MPGVMDRRWTRVHKLNSHGQAADGERGAVAIFVAVLLVALFGFGAYVIDAGAIYQERSGLQDGADSAALALAFDCLVNDTVTTCSDTATTRNQAEFYAESNSDDDAATILDIDFDTANNTVAVTVGTLDATDSNDEIDFVLAPALGEGTNSAGFSSQATGSWGTPIDLPIVPIAISWCDWNDLTTDGTDFSEIAVPILPIPLSLPLLPAPTCDGGPTPLLESGFGYLETSGDCQADIEDGYSQGWALVPLADPVADLNCVIGDLESADRIYVPIFDEIVVAGPNPPCTDPLKPCYRIHGYAALDVDALIPLSLTGHFTDFVALDYFGDLDADLPDLGLNAIRLSE